MCLVHDLWICVTLVFCHLFFYVVTPTTMFAGNLCSLYFNLFYFLISTLIFTTCIKINLFIITNSDQCASDDIQQLLYCHVLILIWLLPLDCNNTPCCNLSCLLNLLMRRYVVSTILSSSILVGHKMEVETWPSTVCLLPLADLLQLHPIAIFAISIKGSRQPCLTSSDTFLPCVFNFLERCVIKWI